MSKTVFVTELRLNNEIVYRRELYTRKDETILFRQFLADSITGEEVN